LTSELNLQVKQIGQNFKTDKLLDSSTGDKKIGELTKGSGDQAHWSTQTFDIYSLLKNFSGSNLTIGFKFNETTKNTDTFYLDKSVLSGTYTAVSISSDHNGSGHGSGDHSGCDHSSGDNHSGDDHNCNPNVTPVPEPGTMMLLGIGMFGLAVFGKRRMNKEA
jgi:hypothetical protein